MIYYQSRPRRPIKVSYLTNTYIHSFKKVDKRNLNSDKHTVNYYRYITNTNTYIQFRTLNKNYDGEYNVSVSVAETVNNCQYFLLKQIRLSCCKFKLPLPETFTAYFH